MLEARARVGGRVHSRRLENGAVIEMGAEFILPGNTLVIEMAERFGLEIAEKGMRYGRREPRGGAPVDPDAFERAVAGVGAALEQPGGVGRESAASLLARLEIDPASREAILARVEISSACPAGAVPATDLAGVAYIGDEPASSLAAGNQGLAEALATELEQSPRLGEPVRRVAWTEAGVRAVTAGGTEVEADVCVIAVPARVAGEIAFEPALPSAVATALEGIAYGQAAKLLVPLRAAVEPSAVLSVPERYWCLDGDRGGRAADGAGQLLQRLGVGARGRSGWRPGPSDGWSRWPVCAPSSSSSRRRGAVALGRRPLGRRRLSVSPEPDLVAALRQPLGRSPSPASTSAAASTG